MVCFLVLIQHMNAYKAIYTWYIVYKSGILPGDYMPHISGYFRVFYIHPETPEVKVISDLLGRSSQGPQSCTSIRTTGKCSVQWTGGLKKYLK